MSGGSQSQGKRQNSRNGFGADGDQFDEDSGSKRSKGSKGEQQVKKTD